MVDFSSLLRKPAGEAKRPEPLPAGDYPGVITGWETGDQNKNKNPYVRFSLRLRDWPEGQDPLPDVDLSKRTFRTDYYLTEGALWRLDEFLEKVTGGINGRSYEEVVPEVVGTEVLVSVTQYINQRNNDIGNQVDRITPIS